VLADADQQTKNKQQHKTMKELLEMYYKGFAEKANWGHGAAQLGLDLAFRENIRHMIFAHHDPGATTQQLFDLSFLP